MSSWATEAHVKSLLKSNGIQIGKSYGPWKGRRHGAEVSGFGADHPMYPGWVHVRAVVAGDPDLRPNEKGLIPMGAMGQLMEIRNQHYHQILTSAGFEHQVIPDPIEPRHMYRKAL